MGGAFGWQSLQNVLTAHGSNLKVVSYAIGGTTSSFWAREPDLVNALVSENPTAQYVWLSIGGNDVIDFMPECTQQHSIDYCINIIVPRVLNNTQTFLNPLIAKHPTIKIVAFGYDIINFALNPLCRTLGFEIIDGCDDRAKCINEQMVKIQYLGIDAIANLYSQFTSVNLLGSLQAAENYTDVSLENPDLSKWSPSDLIMDNCIHPTMDNEKNKNLPPGFEIVFNNLWDNYFANQTDIY